MKCYRCLNTDPSYFYKGKRGWYCRKCISFGRAMIEEEKEPIQLSAIQDESEEYQLKYPLTDKQKEISHACASLIASKDVLLHCVCGAGKTELVLESISKMLSQKKKVCFAIPRRQVVLELQVRLSKYFHKAKVIAVCGGHTQEIDGDLIICTTHQLYRYYKAFDLLILDEPDAFPFRGNPVLHGIAKTCYKGHCIYLSATPDETLLEEVKKGTIEKLNLFQRPHGKPLPVPIIQTMPNLLSILSLFGWIKTHQKEAKLIFVPTIQNAKMMYYFLHLFYPCDYLTSKSEDRDAIIKRFRKKKNGLMICTTVMERGVTIDNATVCIWHADHSVFDKASLIQIAGRVGRSMRHPTGDVLFLCQTKRKTVYEAKKDIEEANHALSIV